MAPSTLLLTFFLLIATLPRLASTQREPTIHTPTMKDLFYFTGACNTEHNREIEDPEYYSSNSNMPHDPSSTGFMGTHGTMRFVSVHEQTALLTGEGKHGVWRVHENGFVRVYRRKGKEGIPEAKKEAIQDVEQVEVKESTQERDEETNRMFDILDNDYQSINPNFEFEYSFGEEVSEEKWLNWIDLPIYHSKFKGKYDDHVAIDLPFYYCQMSSYDFPHMGSTWHLLKAQPHANKPGPLGKRAGLDIRENVNDIVQFYLFDDAGIWANVGQGDRATDFMPKNLEELKNRVQTAHWRRVDKEQVKTEVYIMERSYHNSQSTYLSMVFVMDEYSYIRPDGRYYDELVARGVTLDNIATLPHNNPTISIENETIKKEVFGLATYGHHHMARIANGLIGGGCPNKGGDVSIYPWGDAGAGWPTNYEEVTPICDAFLIDIKAWANLDGMWYEEDLFLGNAGDVYAGQKQVMYQAHANHYGKFNDKYNTDAGRTNPYELDLTKDGEIQEKPDDPATVPVVNFTLDFGMVGRANNYNPVNLDLTPRTCLAGEAEAVRGGAATLVMSWGSVILLVIIVLV